MSGSGPEVTQKIRARCMSSVAIGNTFALAENWIAVLRSYTPKSIARRIGASPRTVEKWMDGENGPTWRHTVAMLNDDELCARLLEAAGRMDLAHDAKRRAAEKLLAALNVEGK